MKNLFLTMTAGLILLTSCSKDDSTEQINDQTTNSIFTLEQHNDRAMFIPFQMEETESSANFTTDTRTNEEFAHSNGLFDLNQRNPVILNWDGYQSNTGINGNASLKIVNPSFSLNIKMEPECIMVEGNAAVYGGIITEVRELSGNTPPLTVNWKFYFQVIDTESGSPTDFDLISNTWFFASPRSRSLCTVYPPNHRIWSSNGHQEVTNPGYVVVSSNQ
jgi:hypothetical protein